MTTNPVTTLRSKVGVFADGVMPPSISAEPLARLSWRTPIAAAAFALVLGLAVQDASALALGRVNVLSALGEPLRAEIEVPEITADEAATLRTAVAGPEAFRAAGLEYNTALAGVQISLQRRANGSAYLRLSSDRPVNEPFVDLILEANWASGRIVRDYTMLFDPSNMRAAAASSITAPAAQASAPSSVSSRATSSAAPATSAASVRPARAERMAEKPAKIVSKSAQAAPQDGIKVKQGDTAAALAARYKPGGVSLDQMLVAMLNASPDAFANGNINRLKSGAVIDMQSAAATAPGSGQADAKQTIVAQSKDFNEFRRRLASGAPTANAAAPGRAAGGKVQANVSEPKAQASAPDKLTLSKGSVAAKAKEEAIAKEKQAKDNATRVAELSKNIQELNKIGTSTVAKPGAAMPTAVASAPGIKIAIAPAVPAVTATATATASAPAASTTATMAKPETVAATPTATSAAPIATPTATIPASTISGVPATSTAAAPATATATVAAAAPAPAPKPKSVPPPPPPEPTFIESLMDNPLLIPGAGALLAGLGGLAFWRMRQKKNNAQVDSSFLESRLQPDSFFGASGGQRVDTADSGAAAGAGSSMVYSPSQLDAAGDVDPVAEADVYLAYGRDLQAEEILKEAMRTNPSRVAIHAKLMEIYAKRRDTKAFEGVAKEAFNLTKGAGPEWDASSTLGREIDPSNPLYQQGNAPAGAGLAGSVTTGAAIAASAAMASAAFNSTRTAPQIAQADKDFDVDLDLDFSSGSDDLAAAPVYAGMISTPVNEPTLAMRANAEPESTVDFAMSMPPELFGSEYSLPDEKSLSQGLNFSAPPSASAQSLTEPMALKTGPSEPGPLEFDLGGLSLDLPDLAGSKSALAASDAIDAGVSGDPLETKLALAMEFRDIGDADGARSLVAEVVEEATGALKARATKMLADLG